MEECYLSKPVLSRRNVNQEQVTWDESEVDTDTVQAVSVCSPGNSWKATFQRVLAGGAKTFIALYDRQLRHRLASLKLGVQCKSRALEAELQLHASQSATLLSDILRFHDALEELAAAADAMQHSLQQLYPGSSAVEPARGMQDVRRFVHAFAAAPADALQLMVEALQVHCDIALPAVQENVHRLRQLQDSWQFDDLPLTADCDGDILTINEQSDNLEENNADRPDTSSATQSTSAVAGNVTSSIPAVNSRTPNSSKSSTNNDATTLRHQLQAVHQQSGYLWDSLRLKLHRIVQQMRQDLLAASAEYAAAAPTSLQHTME